MRRARIEGERDGAVEEAGWVPADETDVGPYWKASAHCTRTPSSAPDIWAWPGSACLAAPGNQPVQALWQSVAGAALPFKWCGALEHN